MNSDQTTVIRFGTEFKADYKRWRKSVAGLSEEIEAIVDYVTEVGEIPTEYNPHELTDPDLPYYGLHDFHLFDGKIDLVVIYNEYRNHRVINFLRLGPHKDLFTN